MSGRNQPGPLVAMSTAGEITGRRPLYYSEPRTYRRDPLDWYVEPPWCVDLLADAEADRIPRYVWDPACGCGTIPKALGARGIDCHASDIADRGYGRSHVDFFTAELPDGIHGIVTNPPYSCAQAFADRALWMVPYAAVLAQAKFLFSARRHSLFTGHPPARLYFLSTRPSMPPGSKLLAGVVEPRGGKADYVWIVWDTAHAGPTEAHWLRRRQ